MAQKAHRGMVVISLCLLLLFPNISAHEQETLNVILVEDDVRPGNVTDPSFVESNSVVFRMRDNTENISMRVLLDLNQNGNYSDVGDNVSKWLTRTCEPDENGSLVDEMCAVSHEYVFNSTSRGVYLYQIERALNGTVLETWNYSITVHPDIHEEPGVPTVGDCFGAGCLDEEEMQSESVFQVNTNDVLKLTLGVSVIGSIMLIFSIQRERNASFGDGEEQLRDVLESE